MTNTECIEWTGYKNPQGYGRVRSNGRMELVHRVAWRNNYFCEIPDGMHVLHTCDNPSCFNPEHLFLGTHADNMRDREEKGRANQPKGSDHGRSKLTETDVPIIRQRLLNGESQRTIARDYGVRQQTISSVKRNKLWRHI